VNKSSTTSPTRSPSSASNNPRHENILTINSGSSSLKFAVFRMGSREECVVHGDLDRIGLNAGHLRVWGDDGKAVTDECLDIPDHASALRVLFEWLGGQRSDIALDAVGHRLVHGGAAFSQPHLITADVIEQLNGLVHLAPDHLPHEIRCILAVRQRLPEVTQVACFDTAFHHSLPRLSSMFGLPRSLWHAGVRRYGFHGLSCEYILQELTREAGAKAAAGRVIIAHLGSGASMTAVLEGRSIDTTMGLTPLGGLVMGTRCGDLDPGALLYILRERSTSLPALDHLLNKESGLLGVSAISSEMKELLDLEGDEPHAAEAVALFCYQARKFLGALAAALGGLDTLVFTGGVGENAPSIRRRICKDMSFIGLAVDPDRNERGEPVISLGDSRVTVRVMKTDEERMIARHTRDLIRGMKDVVDNA
jgi:acetate kinase